MSDRTITALYDQKTEAERARDALKNAGISGGHIDIHDQGDTSAANADDGFMGRLRGFFGDHQDSHAYAEGLRRGHFLLTAKVDENEVDQTVRILESSNAIDFDQTQESWRNEGWTGTSNAAFTNAAAPTQAYDRQTGADGRSEEVIPILEEQLRVGKREVERGGVRVRSYVVETPVHDQVTLRDERVSIERRPASQSANTNATFQDRDIHITETAEEAVLAKDTIVREELVVRKEVGEHVEEINDSVRRTEVEVEDTTSRANPAGAAAPRNA